MFAPYAGVFANLPLVWKAGVLALMRLLQQEDAKRYLPVQEIMSSLQATVAGASSAMLSLVFWHES